MAKRRDGEWSTSEGNVDAWLQDHPMGRFTCDGKNTTTVSRSTRTKNAVGGQGYGDLDTSSISAPAKSSETDDVWGQFCLFDGQGNFVYHYEWVHAR